jgi:hypothetical protein
VFCPADGGAKFRLRRDFTAQDAAPWVDLARTWGIDIGGFEFIETVDGRRVTYDINTNTNYNPDVDAEADVTGPAAIARYLGSLLAREQAATARTAPGAVPAVAALSG